jgi:hypothetical protein
MVTQPLLFLLPILDPGFPNLNVNQAVAMSLIVTFVGYSSATAGYWIQLRVAFDVAARSGRHRQDINHSTIVRMHESAKRTSPPRHQDTKTPRRS